jgi:hypothetical protein
LIAILDTLPPSFEKFEVIGIEIVKSYRDLLKQLELVTSDDFLSRYNVEIFKDSVDQWWSYLNPFRTAIKRLIAYIDSNYEPTERKMVGIGNIIHIIKDTELKERCLDLLAAEKNFDRVIREATTILENRIRSKADPTLRQVGVDLVDTTLNPTRGKLIIPGEPNEKEGYYQMFRGIMLSFRDETHHKILDSLTREDASQHVMRCLQENPEAHDSLTRELLAVSNAPPHL